MRVALAASLLVACRINFDVVGDATPDGLAQRAYIKASNTGAGHLFGSSIALSRDGNTLAVGAYREASIATGIDGDQTNLAAPNAGAVYVFTYTTEGWQQQAYIKASNTDANDQFGIAVALSDDGSTLAVGADRESSNGNQADNSVSASGAVYILVRTGATWTQQAYLKSPTPVLSASLGEALAISGDGSIVVAGAALDSACGIDCGAAYVFTRAGTTWSGGVQLLASNSRADALFGLGIAISADGSVIVVGSVGESSAATGVDGNSADQSMPYAGAAYVFTRVGATWGPQAYIKASNTQMNNVFGSSIVLSADGSELIVSSPWEGSPSTGIDGAQTQTCSAAAGASYLFTTPWAQRTYFKASNTTCGDQFASALAASADGSRLLVGAALEDSVATGIDGDQSDESRIDAGAAYLFSRQSGAWEQIAYIKASNSNTSDEFGNRAAMSGDGSTIAIGAFNEDSAARGIDGDQTDDSATDSGAVYVYR